MTKIHFIWHDCFLVETETANFVFDYWLDADGVNRPFPLFLDSLKPDKPLYVLVSHGHKDHYNPHIFGWASKFADVHYVVSKDVWRRIRHIVSPASAYSGPKVDCGKVIKMGPGDNFYGVGVHIKACPSTDVGNSYIVETCDRRLFHAGDLNAWIWIDQSTPAEINKALGDYRACLRDIGAYLRSEEAQAWRKGEVLDFCFFPVDSRIGSGYATGARMMLESFKVLNFYPMHTDLGDEAERMERKADAQRFMLSLKDKRSAN